MTAMTLKESLSWRLGQMILSNMVSPVLPPGTKADSQGDFLHYTHYMRVVY